MHDIIYHIANIYFTYTPYIEHTRRVIENLPTVKGCKAVLRRGNVSNNKQDGENIAVTDNGNYIIDLFFDKPIADAAKTAAELKNVVGVVDHGIFAGMTTAVIIMCNACINNMYR